MNKINDIINKYINYVELYDVLKEYYQTSELDSNSELEIVDKLKKIIVNYYLCKYKFDTYLSLNDLQFPLLQNLMTLCDLQKKVQNHNGKLKVYPIMESDNGKEKAYENLIQEMVDYQIDHDISIEDLFSKYTDKIKNQLNEFKQYMMNSDMELYYGSIYYMVERSLFIIDCVKDIPNVSIDLNQIKQIMLNFKQTYIDSREDYKMDADFVDVNSEFYDDYELIEVFYKKLISLENDLAPVVIDEWKKYLTNPEDNEENYRYVMHCFTAGMVPVNSMSKACCSLYTPNIYNNMMSNYGLIYDIDVKSLDTMCTDDVGSWTINKMEFINCGCPSNMQLTNLEGNTVYYENPFNSKIIMPDVFDDKCVEATNKNRFAHYSEMYLNNKARAIGVFYTEECQNIDEIAKYAEMYNLPLVKISNKTRTR